MKLVSVESERGDLSLQSAYFEMKSKNIHRILFASERDVSLPEHCDHFFLVGAAIAFVLGEDYEQHEVVCETLLANVDALMRQWCVWYPERRQIRIAAPVAASAAVKPGNTAAFFTGGVDSMFTAARLGGEISTLITIAHVRQDVSRIRPAFDRNRDLTAYADATGRRHLLVATNVMTEVGPFHDAWAYLAHGAGIAAAAHFLSAEVGHVQISSSRDSDHLLPWGSHPKTDPLLSSSRVSIGHFGAEFTRERKTAAIASNLDALKVLSVCDSGRLSGPYVNCSRCEKCLRTMVTLDLAGVDHETASTFDWSAYRPGLFAGILLRTANQFVLAREIVEAARRQGREDIAQPVEHAIVRSGHYRWLLVPETYLRRRARWLLRHKKALLAIRSVAYRLLRLRRSAL